MTRCGFITLIGAPNAGKSTLMNHIIGAKVSIVTPKAQTTRTRVVGVVTEGEAQLIFVDVPGVFSAKRSFEQSLVRTAWGSLAEADVVCFLYDTLRQPTEEVEAHLAQLVQSRKRVFIILNKVDALDDKKRLLPLVPWFQERVPEAEIFMVSALTGDGVADLKTALAKAVPEGVWHYPEDHLTDLPKRLLASELTREQCFLKLHDELPYCLTVDTETYEERKDGSVKINQVITVETERQKAIVLGAKGAMLKRIGEAARKEISRNFDQTAHVFLFVRVREDWKNKAANSEL
jgi:GTP-binding protein Era